MGIEQWGFFSLPHQMWHGTSVYNGHIRGPVTLTPIAERLTVELSLPVLTTLGLSRLGFENPTLRLRDERSNRLRHRSGLWKGNTLFLLINITDKKNSSFFSGYWIGQGEMIHAIYFLFKTIREILMCMKGIAKILENRKITYMYELFQTRHNEHGIYFVY